jgi:methylenetetrahydrofolate dehydrogenase (NADP+) / methenyltetrahydrofolate cyclohydrolase
MRETFKEFVARRKIELKDRISKMSKKPCLVIVQVGDVDASNRYVAGKLRDCAEVGVEAQLSKFDESVSETDLLQVVEALNKDDSVDGFIVQLPLPKHIDPNKITEAIDPNKDVDGFSKLAKVNPATPQGIIDYLVAQDYDFKDKNAVVIGRSNIVGKPMARLLLEKNCNVTVLHSKTSDANKRFYVEGADLIVTAVGKNDVLTNDYKYKANAVVIDVGMNRDAEGKLIGDCARGLNVAFQSPVPGSVGLTTRLTLITNLLRLC